MLWSLIWIALLAITCAGSTPCPNRTGCAECVASTSCVWCDTYCANGVWYGSSDINCKGFFADWRWKQCALRGGYLLILAGAGFLVLCCCFPLCVCCCCWRMGKGKKTKNHHYTPTYSEHDIQKESLIPKEKAPKTNAKREELAKKYSFLRKDNVADPSV